MSDLPTRQTVYPCEEYGEVAVPIASLLKNGELDVYPGIAGSKGYFDIDYRKAKLMLRATRYVGLIPISDSVAIHVRPRAPIGNLLWMVARSGMRPARLEGFLRSYQHRPGESKTPEELYLEVFLSTLERIRRRGLLKTYQTRESDSDWRGRPLVSRTVARFRSKGYAHRAVFQVADYTADSPENRALKHITRRLLRHLEQSSSPEDAQLAARAVRLMARLGAVHDDRTSSRSLSRTLPSVMRRLRPSHAYYEPALWLAYLIATRSGVAIEQIGRARFESVVVDVGTVFENYVRRLCMEAVLAHTHFRGLQAVDGNRVPIRLFRSGRPIDVQPDVYFTAAGRPVSVADAKYKPEPGRGDRHEMVAFCEAAEVGRAAFVCPQMPGTRPFEHYGTTPRGLEIALVRIDLNASDMNAEEAAFLERLSAVLESGERATAA